MSLRSELRSVSTGAWAGCFGCGAALPRRLDESDQLEPPGEGARRPVVLVQLTGNRFAGEVQLQPRRHEWILCAHEAGALRGTTPMFRRSGRVGR
jgi:hypothetical protein